MNKEIENTYKLLELIDVELVEVEQNINSLVKSKKVTDCEKEIGILNDVQGQLKEINKTIHSIKNEVVKEKMNNYELLRAIAHEYKTPNSKISTILYLYETNVVPFNDKKAVIKEINDVIRGMDDFIMILLNALSKRDVLEVFDLRMLIEQILNNNKIELRMKQVVFDIPNIKILVSESNILLLLNNIISNAIKHSGDYIEITAKEDKIYFKNDTNLIMKEKQGSYGMKIIDIIARQAGLEIELIPEYGYFTFVLDVSQRKEKD